MTFSDMEVSFLQLLYKIQVKSSAQAEWKLDQMSMVRYYFKN